MLKTIILVIIITVTFGITEKTNYFNLVEDNSVECENVLNLVNQESKLDNALNKEVNDIDSNLNSVIQKEETKKEEIKDNNYSDKDEKNVETEKNINITSNTNVTNQETKENKEETKKDENEKKSNTQEMKETNEETKKVDNQIKEPIYNQSETNRMKEAIDKFAKQNPDLIGKNGEKLYSIRISKDAMEYNYFSPYRDNQIEAKVANVFSCTFVIYAVDVNGCTRYYIGIE